ncbi:Cathepsin B-like cysteine proteinase 3 [Trichinella nativa]|uniref:Cathepsin B-like cysteine proteinase 3 n=1 Tax=Trichinella nativa TaxID=6335 RepID=A0A0V1LQX3_9BILA|nr:Cathepsin B-like cysteine proteinase 3 [Trichinella nativa]
MNAIFFSTLIPFIFAAYYEDRFSELEKVLSNKFSNDKMKWEFGKNPYFKNKSLLDMKRLLGSFEKPEMMKSKNVEIEDESSNIILPKEYDVRKAYPHCKYINFIKDQSNCGSCWAVSSASVMSDRHCIATNGTEQPFLSEEELISCCKACGLGCDGGYVFHAFEYWVEKGLPSGGAYGWKTGCKPYSIAPCNNCDGAETPKCKNTCIPEYPLTPKDDKYFGHAAYRISNSPHEIMRNVLKYGPVAVTFAVYEDFFYYKKGVYHHTSGSFMGFHAVRLLGWGRELGNDFWLIANSWNTTFGEKGFFKIRRGCNECGIEGGAAAANAPPVSSAVALTMITVWLLFTFTLTNAAYYEETYNKLLKEIQEKNDLEGLPYTFGKNAYFEGASIETVKRLLGFKGKFLSHTSISSSKNANLSVDLPFEMDARKRWPQCKYIGFVRDQANCGSCWAVSSASVMTDRICIESVAAKQPLLSEEELVSCCKICGYGCDGGYPDKAFIYWATRGIPTGGPYGSTKGCKPYSIGSNSEDEAETPLCTRQCINEYPYILSQDRHFGEKPYWVNSNEEQIMQELYENGPVVVAFNVYEDFMYYVKGVYEHRFGKFLGGHAVKLIGWGIENSKKYWLISNSWNTTWGENGFFKIIRGKNCCAIEKLFPLGIQFRSFKQTKVNICNQANDVLSYSFISDFCRY